MGKNALTQKQELFANAVAEGSTYSDAYRHAYNAENMTDKQIWEESSKLMANPKVSQRVFELQERAREKTVITIQKQTERIRMLGEKAEKDNKYSDALKAEAEINKLHGLIVSKSEVTRKRDLTDLDDNEIDALIASAESREGEEAGSPSKSSSVH